MSRLQRTLEVLLDRKLLGPALTWKKFSLAAFRILTTLKHSHIVPSTIIDVGANVGQFAVACGHLYPDAAVYPIEPDPRTAARLRSNLPTRLSKNVIVSAVGAFVGKVAFHANADSQVSSLLNLGLGRINAFPDDVVLETLEVPITTLDSLFASAKLRGPVLLKIDVQGYEDRVIAGAVEVLKGVRWVILEMSFSQLYEGENDFASMLDLMSKCGFRFVRPLDFHIAPGSKVIIEMDALFESKTEGAIYPAV